VAVSVIGVGVGGDAVVARDGGRGVRGGDGAAAVAAIVWIGAVVRGRPRDRA
jgi:hypothetical protein